MLKKCVFKLFMVGIIYLNRWLTSKHIDRREQGLFCHHLGELMCQETKAKFDVKLEEFYNLGFEQYHRSHILQNNQSSIALA